jgi:import inner membrane translocase subunit TIM9
MVDNCFHACVNDFTSKSLQTKEEGCISKCVIKTMNANERMGQRFAEVSMEQNQRMQES